MLQQLPLLPPPPAIARDVATNDVIINTRGRTEIRLKRITLENPVRFTWEITILHRRHVRATATSMGQLPMAIFHALIAGMNVGLLQPPARVRRTWCAKRFWYSRSTTGREAMQLSCRCGPVCTRHRPLLLITTEPGIIRTLCLGKNLVTDNAFAAVQFVAEQLIAHRYLR